MKRMEKLFQIAITALLFLFVLVSGCQSVESPLSSEDSISLSKNSPPEPIEITFNLIGTGPNSAEGTFSATGLITDIGNASQTFHLSSPDPMRAKNVHGIKILEDANGTIKIKFNAKITVIAPGQTEAKGNFVIIEGTCDYQHLHGTGSTFVFANFTIPSPNGPTFTGTYSGQAHFDNGN